ncbi:MAG TPA: hypothetical protein VEJ45_08550 [Candidatus Acidoferrales bacterium]|nr:hypothetical protein [Candidatus Acidoferrales bacterium]
MIRRHRFVRDWLSTLIASALFQGVLVRGVLARGEDGAGLVVSGQATAKDVGLPIYPGAKSHKDTGDDSDAARLALWGGGSGFKLAVLKMESKDAPARVADFYRKALTKYGKVLDCGSGVASDQEKNDSRALTCGNDKPDQDGVLLKAGTKEKQHIVAIEPYGNGTTFALIYLWAKSN